MRVSVRSVKRGRGKYAGVRVVDSHKIARKKRITRKNSRERAKEEETGLE